MAQIDLYLRSLERFGAAGVVLQSGSHVVLRFPSGDRHATQATPHDHLVAKVQEIAPGNAWALISAGSPAGFDYESEGNAYRVTVSPKGSEWTVVLEPAALEAAAPAAEPAPPAEMQIERTRYAPADDTDAESDLPIVRTQYQLALSVPAGEVPAEVKDKLIDKLLITAKQAGASDLHLCTGSPPLVRLHGEIRPLEGYEVLKADDLLAELLRIVPDKNQKEYEDKNDTDFGYTIPRLSRFRANLFRDRKGPGAVFRAIPFEMPSARELGLPPAMLELCKLTKGLVVVTGPTGSGKSTTLAAMIDHINETRNEHIITIEDPIEFMHRNKKCLINQREVGSHTDSFKNALRAALREDPDIVLVGEMRDLETIAIAIETAETGHLVFGTLHTTTAPSTIDRIIDQFSADRQEQVRTMLAESLQGVIAQVLCRREGGGRVAAFEVLLGSAAVSNMIRERKTFQLFSIMQTGKNQGMRTMNDSLLELVSRKLVDPDEAYAKAVNKDEFKGMLQRAGVSPG